jgi:hypothetical protein
MANQYNRKEYKKSEINEIISLYQSGVSFSKRTKCSINKEELINI